MTQEEYKIKIVDLFARWQKVRDYDVQDVSTFTNDGINIPNYDAWQNSALKILFLIKEDMNEYGSEWHPWDDPDFYYPNPTFGYNIARWRFALNQMFKNPSKYPDYPENEVLTQQIKDIAFVEVKKKVEGKKISPLAAINEYAAKDKYFLKEEIDLINPHIVFCCYTIDAYAIIYSVRRGMQEFEEISKKISNCNCFKHGERLIINFYHPSHTRYPGGTKALFEVLCEILQNGKIFEYFRWGRSLTPIK